MIVSHRYQFIFLKTGKVGGTSLEIALSKHLGEDDIITPIKAADELVRSNLGFPGPQNYIMPFGERTPREHVRALRSGLFRRRRMPKKYWNHMPAILARKVLGERIWQNYYRFSVERNPWDQAVSRYYWEKPEMSFADFIRRGRAYKRPNYDIYSIHGLPVVDRVVRYEDLDRELAVISQRIGYPEDLYEIMKQISSKSGYRQGRADYRELYDGELRDIVGLQYAREIALHGYKF